MSKIRVQQSIMCFNLNHYKIRQICQQRKQKGVYKHSTLAKTKDRIQNETFFDINLFSSTSYSDTAW